MNIDFVAILNAALTESVGTMVTQQLAFIVKPIEDMAQSLHDLTERLNALEDGDVKFDGSSLTEIIEGLQRDVAIHDEHLKLLGAGLGERVADHMNDILLRGEGRFAENLKATLDGAIEDIDFGQKVEDVLNAGRLDVTFRS